MILTMEKSVGPCTYGIYSYGKNKTIVIDDPDNQYFYRNEWEHVSLTAKTPAFLGKYWDDFVIPGLPVQYKTGELQSFLEKNLAFTAEGGPSAYHYEQQIPGLYEMVKHPVEGHLQQLTGVIQNLNDKCGWTREQIADWLETLDINPILN